MKIQIHAKQTANKGLILDKIFYIQGNSQNQQCKYGKCELHRFFSPD